MSAAVDMEKTQGVGTPTRIAVDAMGGDRGPEVVIEGALRALGRLPVELHLVGDKRRLEPLLERAQASAGIVVHHATDVVAMDAHPVEAVKKQKDSSIVVAARLVKEGAADALVSAGSTGAAMASSLLLWGRIPGIERPAIGTLLPTLNGVCVLLDAGAQVDSRPRQLCQFALMGSLYAERALNVDRPKVGLLNNGEEEGKGSEPVREAYSQLKDSASIHFIGNIEGRDILTGRADVVVCDGFVGNVVLKFAEGMGKVVFDLLKEGIHKNVRTKLGGYLLRPALVELARKMDYAEYGGAPLLGVRGNCVISHGASDAKAIMNAIRVAHESASGDVVGAIARRIQENGW